MSYKLKTTPDQHETWRDTGFDWADLAAGGYSALDSALFGIPTAIVKAASSDAYQKLKKLREENKVASSLGDIAGMFAPTGGLIAKGVGGAAKVGAKALGGVSKLAKGIGAVGQGADTVADIIRTGGKLKGVGGAAVRGGLTAAEQAVPRLLTGQQDLGEAASNIALGGALGAGGKIVGEGLKRVPELLKSASKWGSKTMLKAAEVDPRALRAQAKYLGMDPDKAEEFVKRTAKEIGEKQLYREPMLDKYRKDVDAEWEQLASVFDKAKVKIAPLKADIASNEVVQNVISRGGKAASKQLDDLIAKVDNTKGLGEKRKYLTGIIFGEKADDEVKALASAVKRTLDDTAESLAGTDLTKMKSEYPIKKMLQASDLKSELSTKGGGLPMGSDTLAKLALGGIGAGVGGSAQIKGVLDDPTDATAWTKLLGATLGGGLTGALSKQIGFQMAKVAMKADPDDLALLIKKAAAGVGIDDLQKTIAAIESKVSPILAKTDADIVLPKVVGARSEEAVAETEATTEPEVQEAAKEETNSKYTTILKSIMQRDWENYFADQMTYEDFEAQVAELTDNFDPLKTASIVFKDPKAKEKYLTDYNVAMKLKDVDVSGIMKQPSAVDNILEPKSAAAQRKAYTDFIDTISTLVTDGNNLPSKATKDTIAADVKAIADLGDASPEEKRQLLFDKLGEKYNLDINTLSQLGVL